MVLYWIEWLWETFRSRKSMFDIGVDQENIVGPLLSIFPLKDISCVHRVDRVAPLKYQFSHRPFRQFPILRSW